MKSFFIFLQFLLITVTPVLLLASPRPASCSEEIKIIKFAEEANWPPFTPDKFGVAEEGLSYELMQAIFSRLDDFAVEIELLPQKRMLEYVKTGLKDGVTVISINNKRQEYLEFTEPLFSKRGYIYYSSSRKQPIIWDDYADLQGLTIGIVAGHNYGEKFSSAVRDYKLKIVSLSNVQQGFDLLLAGRIDGYMCINITATHFLQNPSYSGKITHSPKSYYSKDYHTAFSKKSSARLLIPRINEIITRMKEDGSLAEILSPYLHSDEHL